MPRPTETLPCGCVIEQIGGQWWYVSLCRPHAKDYFKSKAKEMWVQMNKVKGVIVSTAVAAVTYRSSKLIAHDGTVCNTRKEMLEINEAIDKLFLKDKLWKIFARFQHMETSDWFCVNVLGKTDDSLCEMARRLFKFARKR